MSTVKQSATPQPAARQQTTTATVPVSAPAVLLGRQLGNANLHRWLQAKLTISDPQDIYEQEADRVADQVMRMPDAKTTARSPLQIQRVELQRSNESAEAPPAVDPAFESSIGALSGRGHALPESVRSFMEPRFNADFRAVRVHADPHAHELARTVRAQAFTVGRNVVFGAGHYSPETDSGKRLLAHELTHVVQQGQAPGNTTLQRQPSSNAPEPRLEDFKAAFGDLKVPLGNSPFTFGKAPSADESLRNLGTGADLDGTPLPAGVWRDRRWKKNVRPDSESVLRLTSTGEIFTEQSLINWAMNQDVPPERMIRDIESGATFSGTPALRARFAKAFKAALEQASLDERRKAREAERVEHAKENKDLRDQRKALKRSGEARIVAGRRGELSSAMAELAGTADNASLLDIYSDLQALKDGSQWRSLSALRKHSADRRFQHQMDGLPVSPRQQLQASIEARLQSHGLGTREFVARVARFEEKFRRATLDLATDSLDRAQEMCEDYLNEPGKLYVTADAIFASLNPVRKSLVGELDRADRLTRKGYVAALAEGQGEFDPEHSSFALMKEAHDTRALTLGLVTATLNRFPFVAWPDFPREELLRASNAQEVSGCLGTYFQEHIKAIKEVRDQIGEPRRLYRLDALLTAAIQRFEIPDGSIFRQIIAVEKDRAADMSVVEKVEAVLVFALIAASMLVPGAQVVAAPLMAGIGIHGAAKAVQEYTEDHAAFQVGLKSVDPSVLWVVVAMVGAGLDVQGAMHVLTKVAALEAAARNFNRASDLAGVRALSNELGHVPESELNPVLREAIESTAERRVVADSATHGNPTQQLEAGKTATAAPAAPAAQSAEVSAPAASAAEGERPRWKAQGEQPVGVRLGESHPVPAPEPRKVPQQQQTQQQMMGGPRKPPGGSKTPPDGVASSARKARDERNALEKRRQIEERRTHDPERRAIKRIGDAPHQENDGVVSGETHEPDFDEPTVVDPAPPVPPPSKSHPKPPPKPLPEPAPPPKATRASEVTQPYPKIEEIGDYTFAGQRTTDGETVFWRIWNWARKGGPNRGNPDMGPLKFLKELIERAREPGRKTLVLTVENISAESLQRTGRRRSPLWERLGASSVEKIDDKTIRVVIPLEDAPKRPGGSGGAPSGGGAASSDLIPRPSEVPRQRQQITQQQQMAGPRPPDPAAEPHGPFSDDEVTENDPFGPHEPTEELDPVEADHVSNPDELGIEELPLDETPVDDVVPVDDLEQGPIQQVEIEITESGIEVPDPDPKASAPQPSPSASAPRQHQQQQLQQPGVRITPEATPRDSGNVVPKQRPRQQRHQQQLTKKTPPSPGAKTITVTEGDKLIVKLYMEQFMREGMEKTAAKRKAIELWLESRGELGQMRYQRNLMGGDRGRPPPRGRIKKPLR